MNEPNMGHGETPSRPKQNSREASGKGHKDQSAKRGGTSRKRGVKGSVSESDSSGPDNKEARSLAFRLAIERTRIAIEQIIDCPLVELKPDAAYVPYIWIDKEIGPKNSLLVLPKETRPC